MKEKINIAEILNDKPANTKLYSPLFSEVYFSQVRGYSIAVKHHGVTSVFYSSGKFYDYNGAETLLFPSKEMRDWSKFAWKRGDVLVSNDGKCKVIFDRFDDDTYTSFVGKYYVECYGKNDELQDYEEEHYGDTVNYTKESEEAAQTYIKTIEKRLGGKFNHENLEIENAQPEFKDGDIAFADYGNRQDVFIVSDKTDLSEGYSSFISLDLNSLTLSMGCRTTFFKKDLCKLRLATEEEKKQLFSALEKEGKRWDSNKKAIFDLKPNIELKPFDRVLVRDFEDQAWQVSLFSYKDSDSYYCCNGCAWNQCISYIGNESLLGTTKDVEG